MDDRIPTPGLEGRVKITKEDGTSFLAFLEMADNPSNPGTPISKATLLKDATAALFGLTNTAVPDDVLSWVGKYNLYWWSRQAVVPLYGYNEMQTQAAKNYPYIYKQVNGVIQYSDSIVIDQNTGVISLVNPQSVYVSQDNMRTKAQVNEVVALLDGKYVTGMTETNNYSHYYQTSNVYYVPSGTQWDMNYSDDIGYYYQVSPYGNTGYYINLVTAQIFNLPAGSVSYVNSSDRNAYPDSGESDGFEWEYLGVPFENAVTAPKIVTGSYVGTGTSGEDNPNSLTFDSEPKMVFVTEEFRTGGVAKMSDGWVIFTQTDVMGYSNWNYSFGYRNYFYMMPNWGKTLKWWAADSASVQGNDSGKTYRYIAIC